MNTTLTPFKHSVALLMSILVLHLSATAALIEHFKLDEGATDPGATMIYSAVSANTGNFTSGAVCAPVWVTTDLAPVPGGALSGIYFDASGAGNDPYILTTAPGVLGGNARTVAAWIRVPPGPFSGAPAIFNSGVNATGQRFSVRLNETTGGTTGGLRLEVQGGAIVGTKDLRDGQWHHIAVVKTTGGGPHDSVTLYVDGNVEAVSFRSTGNPTINTTVSAANDHFAIGNFPYSPGNYGFPGSVDDVRLYDAALTQSAILEIIYGSGNPPVISEPPQPQAAVLGDTNATANFTVSFTGSPPVNYQWRHAGTNLPAATDQSLALGPNLSPADLGGYQVVIYNTWGSVTSAVADLTWTTTPIDPLEQAAVAGQRAVFNLAMPSYQVYGYQWQRAGVDIPGATDSTYTRSGLVLADATDYTVRVTLNGQTATSPPASISVFAATASAYANLALEDNPIAYWRLGEANGATVAADSTSYHNGSYLNYAGYELGMAGAPINEADTASSFTGLNYIELPYSAALARTNSITLEAWVNPSGTTGRQSIMGSRSRFISRGYELCANGATWQFRTGASSETSGENWDDLNGGTVTPGEWAHVIGTYDGATKRLYVNGALVGTQTVPVMTTTVPWRLGADQTFLSTAGDFLTGTLDELAIYWRSMTPDQVRDHYNMGILGAGISPSFVVQPTSQKSILGDTNTAVSFTSTVSGSPRLRYQWKQAGTDLAGETASTLVILPVTSASIGTYSLAVSNAAGGIVSANVTLSYTTTPVSPTAQSTVLGGSATFTLAGMPAYQPYAYQWKHAGTNLPGATSSTLTIPAAGTADAGVYTVVATLGPESVESDPVTLTIIPMPTQSYAANVSSDTPVAWWKLDDAPGSFAVANAVTPGTDEGTLSVDATLGAEGALLGVPGTAAAFTGYSLGLRAGLSKIDFLPSATLNPSVFTIECWVMVTGGAGTFRSPVTSRNLSTGITEGYLFYATSDDRWQFRLGNGTTWAILDGPRVALNEWAHLVGTYDGTTASFYVNGALSATTTTPFVPNLSYGLRLGAGATEDLTGNFFFPGRIDEVAVYNRALSEGRVQSHYAAAFQPNSQPRFTLQPLARNTLAGQTLTLATKVHAAPPLGLQWQKNGEAVSGATQASLTLGAASAVDAGTYRLVATSGTGTATSREAIVGVQSGEAVSINLLGFSTNTIAALGGSAGFVSVANWNEVGYSAVTGSASGLVSHRGVTNSTTVTWSGTTTRQWNGPLRTPAADYALLGGFIEANTTNISVTLSSIPADYQSAGYSLLVYFGAPSATAGQVGPYDWFGAVRVGSVTNYYHAVDLAFWDGNFLRATNADAMDMAPAEANYAVFTGLNSSSVTVLVEPHPILQAGPFSISAVQLLANVSQPTPVPLTLAYANGVITLSWTGNWVLQQKLMLDNNPDTWTDVTATSPHTVPATSNAQQFYRLRSP